LTKRNKKRFEAQQMLMMLGTLAHNVIVWARRWLSAQQEKLAQYGMLRLVRDVLHITGQIGLDAHGHVVRIVLNQAAPLVGGLIVALQALLALWELAPKGRYFVVSRCWFKGFISTQIEREALKDVLEIKDAVTPALQHLYPVIEPFYKPTRVSIAKVIRNSVHMLR
jgi:hypothetical protein